MLLLNAQGKKNYGDVTPKCSHPLFFYLLTYLELLGKTPLMMLKQLWVKFSYGFTAPGTLISVLS